jgi:hypothetical protein
MGRALDQVSRSTKRLIATWWLSNNKGPGSLQGLAVDRGHLPSGAASTIYRP